MYLPALKKYNLLLSAIVFVVLFSSCKSSPVAGPEDNIPAGRRDYVWTVDTISNLVPTNSYYFLWGTSPSNLWCGGPTGDYNKMLLHNDGTGWKVFPHEWDGLWVEPWSIFGFSADDFWVGGNYSDLWRYKNGKFYKFGIYNIPEYGKTVITRLWGNSSDDIYATGATYTKSHDSLYSTLLHFDGKEWSYKIKPRLNGTFIEIIGEINSGNYYLLWYKSSNTSEDSTGIYEYNGAEIKRIYYNNVTKYNGCGMALLGDKVYFGFKKSIYSYKEDKLLREIDLNSYNVSALSKINGRSIKDFFVNVDDGIGHFNGTDMLTVFKIINAGITSAVILEKDVYFLCPDKLVNKFYIIHGRLK